MNLQTPAKIIETNYDRMACKIGVVHIGYGAFHRAHQAVYFDRYMEISQDLNWGIAAVNLRSSESSSFNKAQTAADGYLLKTTSPEGEVRYQRIRSHVAFADWSQDVKNAENLLNIDTVHVATITVTESGYYLKENGSLDTDHPVIASEIAGHSASSVYSYLARALQARMTGCGKALTILCCDNIRANGRMLRANFLTYLKVCNFEALRAWVEQCVTFPCSMVDRITPRTTELLSQEIAKKFPKQDLEPVHGESFTQWVLERNFAGPMPDLEIVGAEFVSDVDPYEEAKIRILNGGHTGLCYLGALAGHQTFDQPMLDPQLRAHFDNWEQKNVLPGLSLELPFNKEDYLREVAHRFENKAIADDLARICMDGWSKMQIFIRPTLRSCLKQGISPTFGYDVAASWYVYARRVAHGTMPISYVEPFWDDLLPLLDAGREKDFAENQQLWADLPANYEEFVPRLCAAITGMENSWPV